MNEEQAKAACVRIRDRGNAGEASDAEIEAAARYMEALLVVTTLPRTAST